jgi:hypothetical protein
VSHLASASPAAIPDDLPLPGSASTHSGRPSLAVFAVFR